MRTSLPELGERIKSDVRKIVERRRRLTSDPIEDLPGDALEGVPTRPAGRVRRKDNAAPLETPFADPNVPRGMPVQGRLSSSFGMRIHPIHRKWMPHKGEDIVAPRGTSVRVTAAGVVVHAGLAGTFGNLVEIRHDDRHRTRYAHLDSIAVELGQEVGRGDVVGAVGSTGGATGPHLHYEVLVAGKQVDPAPYL